MTTLGNKETIGSMRHQLELRQICGMMMVFGMCVIFQPLGDVVSAISPDGETVKSGIPFALLFGGLADVLIGIFAVVTGYMMIVHNWGHRYLTLVGMATSLLAWIAYISTLVFIGQQAESGAAFIPSLYEPTATDVRFVGAMGTMSVAAYGFGFLGSISYTLFTLYAHQTGQASQRAAPYFRGRAVFYSALVVLAGLSQLMLGSYIIANFGRDMKFGPIAVGVNVINFPEIDVFFGVFQVIIGSWGVMRNLGGGRRCVPNVRCAGVEVPNRNDSSFAWTMLASWILQLVLHVLVQVGYIPGAGAAAAAPAISGVIFGFNMMPAYLDYKAHSLPTKITSDYYDEETQGSDISIDSVENGDKMPSNEHGSELDDVEC